MVFIALVVYVFRYPIMHFFSEDPEVIAIGAQAMICVSLFQLFDAMNITYVHALQGAGDSAWPSVVNLFLSLVFLGGGDDSLIPESSIFRDLGFIAEEDKFALMKQARATINLSSFESFSFVVMESWLCGTPVIVSAGCEVTAGHVARCDGGYAVVASSDFATALDRLSNAEVGAFPGQAGRIHGHAIFLAANDKPIQMYILPAHSDLKSVV